MPSDTEPLPYPAGHYKTSVTPPITRASMVPQKEDHIPRKALTAKEREIFERWSRAAFFRRIALFILVAGATIAGAAVMFTILADHGVAVSEWLILMIFTLLFGWISFNFWVVVFGFIVLIFRPDRFDVSHELRLCQQPVPNDFKTAVVMPIYNEDVASVFARVRTMEQSLEKSGTRDHFHFFVLSDTSDPDRWVEEESAWAMVCHELSAFGRIFYRHRRVRVGKKSGNIADFCRRWSSRYRYMVVIDADSWMSGGLLTNLVKLMERRTDIGILQTAPKAVGQNTFLSRIQQFSGHLYGSLLFAGIQFWQLGDAGFWGHNAIVRMDPFIKYCALPEVPGPAPLGGKILSHDFVEAALMRRAGWGVWLATELNESYEQLPPSLLGELSRDRRWCLGNLQHLKLLRVQGFSFGHRLLFLIGNIFYGSALLWLALLILLTANGVGSFLNVPNYFPGRMHLFPDWPIQHRHLSWMLFWATAGFLFISKILTLAFILIRKQEKFYGGAARLAASMILETLASILYAPVRMLFYSRFILFSIFHKKLEWNVQQRAEQRTPWRQAVKAHGFDTGLAFVSGAAVFSVDATLGWWFAIVALPLLFAIPLSVWSGSARLGTALRRYGLFLTAEEIHPPEELRWLWESPPQGAVHPAHSQKGFLRAIADPWTNALHLALLRDNRKFSSGILQYKESLIQKFVHHGEHALTNREKKCLLYDPACLRHLHNLRGRR